MHPPGPPRRLAVTFAASVTIAGAVTAGAPAVAAPSAASCHS